MGGRRFGFGGVEGKGQSGVGDHIEAFVGEFEVTDLVMVEQLGARAVVPDVVGAPAAAEVVAASGQLADEVVEVFVVWVAAGLGSQDRNADVGGAALVWGRTHGPRRARGR